MSCLRGSRQVFTGLSFSLDGGEALLVAGPNGAGKSSLLRMIGGLLRPIDGMLTLTGGDPDKAVAEQAHYLGHQDALKPSLTVTENLSFWSRYLGGDDDIDGALGAAGLSKVADLPAAYLSAGQRRRLSIARLIAVPRPLWLLDEPTSALDREGQDTLATLMHKHLAGGGLIVAAAHGPIGLDGAKELRLGASP